MVTTNYPIMNYLKCGLASALLFVCAAGAAQDYPDPTILKDGNDYYVTHSSFVYHPGLLIWHSTNLYDWEPVCRACPEFQGSGYAPDIVKYKDRYYIYYPAANTNYVVWADDIRGPWSKPIDLKVGGIDPGHAVGEDGRRYLFLSNGNAPLVRVRLADDGLSVEGNPVVAYEGWQFPEDWDTEGFWLESPKLMKVGEYYYLTTAEGGTAGPPTSHMVVSARSKSIFGPWENSPYNPIVHTYSASEEWWSKGHGTPFEGPDGKWYIIYHAYPNGFHTLGRVSIIEPLEWTEDGWFKSADSKNVRPLFANMNLSDSFSSGKYGWQWVNWKLSERSPIDSSLNLWLATAQNRRYVTEVKVCRDRKSTAGMLLFYDEQAFAGVIADAQGLAVYSDAKSKVMSDIKVGRRFRLRITNRDNKVEIAIRKPLCFKWKVLANNIDVSGMHHNTYGGFYALRIGLVSDKSFPSSFRGFEYTPAE